MWWGADLRPEQPGRLEAALAALVARPAIRAALAAEAAGPAPWDCRNWALASLALADRGDLVDLLLAQGGGVVTQHTFNLLTEDSMEYESIQLGDEIYSLQQFAVAGEDIGPRMARKRLRLRQMAWSRATHRRFPPAFRAATRALLLAAHRGAAAARAPQPESKLHSASRHAPTALLQLLGSLPEPALEAIVGAAASPLSVWERMV